MAEKPDKNEKGSWGLWRSLAERAATNKVLHLVVLVVLLVGSTSGLAFLLAVGHQKYVAAVIEQRHAPAAPEGPDSTPSGGSGAGAHEAEPGSPREPQHVDEIQQRRQFFFAFDAAIEDDDRFLSIDLEDSEQRVLFQGWIRAAKGDGERRAVTLQLKSREPDGTENYDFRIEDTPVHGVMKTRFEDGSWHLLRIESVGQASSAGGGEAEALKAIKPLPGGATPQGR